MFKMNELLGKLYSLANKYKSQLQVVAAVVLVAVVGCLLWHYFKPPQTVTVMSQEKAESVQGVQQAASNANVPITAGQAKEVATVIREIRTTEQVPVYVTQTTGEKAAAVSEQARKDAKADFAIITGKDNDEVQRLEDIPKDTKVELNQYNVQAYKKVIRQVEVGVSPDGAGKSVGFTVNKKITKDGKYLGVGVEHVWWKEGGNANLVKLVYSW